MKKYIVLLQYTYDEHVSVKANSIEEAIGKCSEGEWDESIERSITKYKTCGVVKRAIGFEGAN